MGTHNKLLCGHVTGGGLTWTHAKALWTRDRRRVHMRVCKKHCGQVTGGGLTWAHET